MTPNEYMVAALAKEADQGKIRERIYAIGIQATRMDNGLRGLTDEVGELAGAVKGWLEYGRPLDTQNILEECGDVLWRTSQILLAAGYTLEEAMKANLRKLNVRFQGAATDHAEADRNREAERAALTGGGSRKTVTTRTAKEILDARATLSGCCDTYANNQACDCFTEAVEREALQDK